MSGNLIVIKHCYLQATKPELKPTTCALTKFWLYSVWSVGFKSQSVQNNNFVWEREKLSFQIQDWSSGYYTTPIAWELHFTNSNVKYQVEFLSGSSILYQIKVHLNQKRFNLIFIQH